MLLEVCRFSVFLIALFATVNGRFTEEEKQLMNQVHSQCISETGTSEDLVTKATTGDFADDDNLKCYVKCIWSTLTVMDDEGNFDVGVLEVMLPADMKDTVMKAMNACTGVGGATPCEKAFAMTKCLYKEAPSDFFLP
ncbi:B2 protein [Nilaparvata lugens]|uniref:Odorant binding protein 7 n=1 Tax=Nilaparvata lugens TaxID=108931 RepID=A0A067XN17_NILLU|nr:B2 protein [Nilaparvata lugens]AGO81741.1 odorant-bindingn protein 8 [Nilaparvata lugens]AGZ04898.1 odorant binding protein 7 [Nilaparvata lugens]